MEGGSCSRRGRTDPERRIPALGVGESEMVCLTRRVHGLGGGWGGTGAGSGAGAGAGVGVGRLKRPRIITFTLL